jgi:thiol-disulfide isomerase/thioredoxin
MISASLILLLGWITIFPSVWEKISLKLKLSDSSNKLLNSASQKQGVFKDILTGVALGPVFTSCSPTYFLILATVLVESKVNGIIALLVYSFGLSVSLFLISYLGQKLVKKLKWAANPDGLFKKFLGLLFILVAIGIITGADKKIETKLLESGFFDITKVEQNLLKITEDTPKAQPETPIKSQQSSIDYPMFTELVSPDGYLNTDQEFLLEDYIGEKIILVQFMTYGCINCQRTFPYFNDWHEKYSQDGLLIVGIHTPEFDYERNQNNVKSALNQYNIKFPVVIDNDKETWRAYKNRFWPRRYLINHKGEVVYDHIGEGAYQETEDLIKEALKDIQ